MTSNIASWAEFFGLDQLATCIDGPITDAWAFYIGLVLFLVGGFGILIEKRLDK